MHLLIPFAAPWSEAGRQAAATLQLPRLQALLARLAVTLRDEADECSLSPPHERALARALGMAGGSGQIPWAAWLAAADGLPTGDLAWGLLTPAHWHLGTEQVSLADPDRLQLAEAESRAFFDAVQSLFTSEGFMLCWGAPRRWYAAHESLAGLACAAPDRVIGRNVDAWLGSDPRARRLRRLQAEVQMLLHAHPLNAAREARGLLPVNSFWVSGCGVAQPEQAEEGLVLDDRLRAPALAEDGAAWLKAWETLDASAIAACAAALDQGQAVRLTLCGERAGASFAAQRASTWRRLRTRWQAPAWPALLESL